jgi:hypothetical protein
MQRRGVRAVGRAERRDAAVTAAVPSGFYLGTHQPGWLNHAGVPLFVSDIRLRKYVTLPVAAAPWALDSGGFSELAATGDWTVSPREYVERARRYRDEVGLLQWAAPQDWMCEPQIIHGGVVNGQRFAGTGLSVAEHQRRTVINYAQLREFAPDLNIVPVIQGDPDNPGGPGNHLRCLELYDELLGVDLTDASRYPTVGIGSVCRIQATPLAGQILQGLHAAGLRTMHGFGFKVLGLMQFDHLLRTKDTMAWSYDARRRPPLPGHDIKHINCANCLVFAKQWRIRLLDRLNELEAA